jgi:hypothetical protein
MNSKWLKPKKLSGQSLDQADSKYQMFIEEMRKKAEEKRKRGEDVDDHLLSDDPERKAGFRGQKWIDQMLFDMGIPHNTYWRDDLPDTVVWGFGSLETKAIPEIERSYVDIKKSAWEIHPAIYLTVVKICDSTHETFQFVGWLYGHQVYDLEFIPKGAAHPRASYRAQISDLNDPRRFLKKLWKNRDERNTQKLFET